MISKQNWKYTFIIFFIILLPSGASALPLGSVTIENFLDGAGFGSNTYEHFYTSFSNEYVMINQNNIPGVGSWFPNASFHPFFIRDITPSDIGSSFIINESNYPYWDNMIKYVLTDGTPDIYAYNLGTRDTMQPLSWNFTQEYFGNGNDFLSYFINDLTMTIDDLHIYCSFENSDGTGTLYCWSATWTLTANGQPASPVPEPATLLILCAGIIGLTSCKRSRCK